MSVQIREMVEKFPDLMTLKRGPAELQVTGPQSAAGASSTSLIFVSSRQHLQEARDSQAQAWVISEEILNEVPSSVAAVITSPNVQLCMALVARTFFPQTQNLMIHNGERIHPSSQIAASARVGENCIVGPGAVIGEHCTIGEHSIIGANAVIEPFVKIGSHTHIHPLVFIGHSCEIGNRCEIQPHTSIGSEGFGYAQDKQFNHYRLTHYGRVVIEDDVHIGCGVQIARGTFQDSRIGSGTKIDNHCHFGHNIQIGRNTLITGGVIVAGSTSLGSHCVFGGRTTISGHLQIGDRVRVGGLSGISKSVLEPGEYAGFPLQDLKSSLRTRAALKSLPELIKQVRRILDHLGLENESLNGKSPE
ncbi:MAG: UDP-3-O-(3-hydroxymyristoyl)glucosamine N-acyltransferase [Bdellovibrionales bacterium]